MKTTSFLILTAALVSCAAVSSAVVPSDPAAAPSDAGGKNHHETSTAGSGGYTQIVAGSDDIPTGLRPTDGTNVGPSSTAITAYLPPNSVYEQLLKKEADVGVPKKDAEVAENNNPATTSDENIVRTTVIPTVKDTGMTIVTEDYCYDCTEEATIWTLGGTDTIGTDTTKDANLKTVADSSFDGNANELVKKEEENGTFGPIVGPVGLTSDMSVHGNANTGPVHLAKTIITADQTLVDATDVMADIANLYDTSIPTPVPTPEAEAEAEEHGAINGMTADVDVPPKSPKNGTTVTSIITNTTTTSDVTSDNNPEVGDDDDDDTSPKAPRIAEEKDGIVVMDPSTTVPGNAKTIVTANHTMIDITDAMAVIAGITDDAIPPTLTASYTTTKKKENDTNKPMASTTTTTTTTTTITTITKKKRRIFPGAKPNFRDDVPVIHRFLLSIPAYLPDPFVLIVIAVESVYDFVATNSVGDVVSKATRVISEGIAKIASGLHYAVTVALGKAVTLLTKAAESITEGIIKIASGLTDAATVALGKAVTLGNEVNATMMDVNVKAFGRCIADGVDTFKANNSELVDGFVAAAVLSLSGLVFLVGFFCILRFFM